MQLHALAARTLYAPGARWRVGGCTSRKVCHSLVSVLQAPFEHAYNAQGCCSKHELRLPQALNDACRESPGLSAGGVTKAVRRAAAEAEEVHREQVEAKEVELGRGGWLKFLAALHARR